MTPLAYQRAGSVLFNSYAGNVAAQQRRLSRGTTQCMTERLWGPLVKYAGHPTTAQTQFLLSLSSMTGYAFTCQVNGRVGDVSLMRAFTSTLLSGFDVVNVSLNADNASAGPGSFNGQFTIAHTRPFGDWQPLASLTDVNSPTSELPQLITLPFSSHIEVMLSGPTPAMSHLAFRAPFLETVADELKRSDAVCPELRTCLGLTDPYHRFLAVRRMAVRN